MDFTPDEEPIPDHLIPPHLRAAEPVPDHLIPDHLKAQPEPPPQAEPDLSGPVTVPVPPDTPQIMEMIAERLSGPVKDMYEADITRGVSHYDAMLRVLDTTAGETQARNAYKSILKEQQRNEENARLNASKGQGKDVISKNGDERANDAGRGRG